MGRHRFLILWERDSADTDRNPLPRVARWVIAGLVAIGVTAAVVVRVLTGG